MKILVNATSAVVGGGVIVARSLTRAMAEQFPAHRFLLACSHAVVAEWDFPANVEVRLLPTLVSRRRRFQWEQFEMPALAAGERIDAVLGLGGYLSFRTRAPQVAVWQNLSVFSSAAIERPRAERWLIRAQRLVQSASMRRAAQNVFLTQNSVEMASQLWPMQHWAHCVIHSGVDPEALLDPPPPPLAQREPYFLSVGHTYSHKNYEVLIDAIDLYRQRYDPAIELRIIGRPVNHRYHQALLERIARLGLTSLVHIHGESSQAEVFDAMSRARAYVVGSQLETFGLTTLEAMGRGVPVVASNATCHPEVCGDAALYCDPADPGDFADALHRLATDSALAEKQRQRGFERVKHFSWQRAARAYVAELETASRGRPF